VIVKFTISDTEVIIGIIAFPDDGGVVSLQLKMSIDAVVACV